MLRVLKVSGDSLSPKYQEGDYVVIATCPFLLHRLKAGDTIIFQHKHYGTLIKRIMRFAEDGQIYVTGAHENSLDSRRIGPVRREAIRGKVIWHVPRPKPGLLDTNNTES